MSKDNVIVRVEIVTGKVLEDNTNKHFWLAQYHDTLPQGYNAYKLATEKKKREGLS